MEPSRSRQGIFSVEIYLKLGCPACSHTLKRRFVDYLTTRASHCPRCSTKMVHLARGQTTQDKKFEMTAMKDFIEELESQWSSLVNESIVMESNPFDLPESE